MQIPERWRRFVSHLIGGGPNEPEVRVMTPEDTSEVVRIIRLHDSDDGRSARHYFEQQSDAFTRPYEEGCHLVLIEPEERRIVGVSGYGLDASPETQGLYWLGWTYVNPYFQGKGYGARLLQVVIEQTRRIGARKLYSETSSLESFEKAVLFYKRFGFIEEARLKDFYREGEDKIFLGLKL